MRILSLLFVLSAGALAQAPAVPVNGFGALVSLEGGAREVPAHFSYRCFDRSFIARSGDGKQAVTWSTAPVPAGLKGAATFPFGVSMTGPGKSKPSEFELLLEGKPLVKMTLPVEGDAEWAQGEVRLRFDYLSADIYDDLEGVMHLTVPARTLAPGRPAQLTLRGLASGSNCFVFLSAIPDVVGDPEARPAANPTRFTPPRPVTAETLQYDGQGLFQLLDRPSKNQGLETLLSRGRVKPWQQGIPGDGGRRWPCERTIFHDEYTGAEVWRLTSDTHAVVRHAYSAVPAWNADGRLIKISRLGLSTFIDQETGTALMPIPPVGGEWSPTEPNILYTEGNWQGHHAIVAYDIAQRKVVRGLAPVRGYCGIAPPSEDGKWVCWREGIQDEATTFGLAATDGSCYRSISLNGEVVTEQSPVTFEKPGPQPKVAETRGGIHQMYFTRRPDHSILVQSNCWNPRLFIGRIYSPEGKLLQTIPEDLSHLSWHPQGKYAVYAGSGATGYDPEKARHFRILSVRQCIEGHTTWTSSDPNWMAASVRSPFAGEILRVSTRPDHSVARLCGTCPANPNTTAYDTDEFGCLSPDGTKVLFMSTMSGSVNEYLVVAANPRPPKLSGAWTPEGYRLTWAPDTLSREVRGYRVYRGAASGGGYREIAGPVKGTSYLMKGLARGQSVFLVVRAQEWSGLTSGFSNEVSTAGRPVTHALEAEAGAFTGFLQGFDPRGASDLYYLFAPKDGIACRVTLPLPRATGTVWARVRGAGAPFSISLAGKAARLQVPAEESWCWVRLGQGGGPLAIATTAGGFELDRVLLLPNATLPEGLGPDHTPNAAFQAQAPAGMAAKAKGPVEASLTWQPVAGARYYNIYASEKPDFTPAQANLLYSPAAGTESLDDWGLKPGTTYTYRVVAVDYDGTESRPSASATVKTDAVAVQTLALEYEAGTLGGGAAVEEDASASGGRCVLLRKGQTYELRFRTAAEGDFVIWHQYRGDSGGDVGGEVSLDGTKHIWSEKYDQANLGGGLAGRAWVWHRYAFQPWSPNPNGVFHLPAGEHTLRITLSGPLHLDRLVITNDLSWVPQGKLCTL